MADVSDAVRQGGPYTGELAVFDPQVERFEPPGWPEGERFLGIDAFAGHTKRARGPWAEGTCEPWRFVSFVDEAAAMAFAGIT